ncbi:MAG: anaerobic ribonucleoside-triphosphate reductase activating protein [Candidatus Bipolaricaulis sp.]|nr:anaerobic ribonucleoside-triphosphate reductase activating protein [Candidatus Bipolaricaulis sp.]MDD5219042.1 anaerobic ribonucleoside-triphosphate reductase activating protein [Candidatus Bipolaricaulis sp.]MDD5646289.1 anaerobic ribonucleoside-triphosphate reductase activating protein [Candidatus Bipolaricaulis sp.]
MGAFSPMSLSDDPGRVSALVFVVGCNLRCPFCHNQELVLPELAPQGTALAADAVLAKLRERTGFLDGVVVSGGEPTLQPDLGSFLGAVREAGLRIKLDTNGSRPEVLATLLRRGLIDYVAMDVKAPRSRYAEYAGVAVDLEAIEASIRAIREDAADYEFRTTVAPGLGEDDIVAIADWIRGARRYVLQPFRVPKEKHLVDPSWESRTALSVEELRKAWTAIGSRVAAGGVRA